ncbi:thiamine pyrophosphate-binding protein [Solirubrobacter ginsenosidimutans]|uniref:Thiamine pyrophosphate-binding protein n=1 Tax=Solirubrobacter ginsenosidimutans TaxID=490573 RepID=A0A9X3N1L1_9ACTN|nr:thiamine pyrophosphate-dependent enzyme [Solirubrobacter ginsenosidimutans]MDA0166749.1 thiamine pyrophosphate-binding protein [Solirubrobacter ginsenosidimutans]
MTTVRDATFDVLRRLGLTTIFSNPGSTEVPLLAGLPDDLTFVLALHEGSVVAMAAGHALGAGRPALALLHSTPGLGNAVAAIATARLNRAPLVIVVGQQDRRHLALDPFLAGKLDGLAGRYPVSAEQPVRAQDVPGAIVRAYHEATTARGPALVVVPMDDWSAPAPEPHEIIGPAQLLRSQAADPAAVEALAAVLNEASRPAIVAGAGADGYAGWTALIALAERLNGPVFQEPFGAQAGFPQDHPQFAGHLPARRERLRETLKPHDAVLIVGTGAIRQYPYDPGPLVEPSTRLLLVTQDPEEAHRSPVELAVLGDPAALCAALAEAVDAREHTFTPRTPPPDPPPPDHGEPLRAAHVLQALADRLPRDAILLEETPSSRPELHARIPATAPLGFISAMGMLGFALPAAIGLRMARPDRPVLTVVGDGSSLYQIQALWSAVAYRTGVLFIVLRNGGYAIMDRLAERAGSAGPWPALDDVDIAAMAKAQGCEARRIETHEALVATLDAVLDDLAVRDTPLLLEIAVAQDATFDP